jgi:hypothetical protein
MIVGAGIVRVVFFGEEPEGWAREVLEAGGVKIDRLPEPLRRTDTGWNALILQ